MCCWTESIRDFQKGTCVVLALRGDEQHIGRLISLHSVAPWHSLQLSEM